MPRRGGSVLCCGNHEHVLSTGGKCPRQFAIKHTVLALKAQKLRFAKGFCTVFIKGQKPVVNNKYVQKALPPPIQYNIGDIFAEKGGSYAILCLFFDFVHVGKGKLQEL